MAALDERLEPLLVALIAAHRVGVDAEREARVGVTELSHHVRRFPAAHVEDRGERVAELVRAHALRQGRLAAPREQLIGVSDDRADHALARVVLVAAAARRGREDQIGGPGARARVAVACELVAKGGEDVDQADPGLGLRAADRDAAVGKVDVVPGQGGRLADPQAGIDQRRDQRAAASRPRLKLRVELGSGVDHRDDLLSRVEVDGPLPLRLQLAVPSVHANGVANDEVALLRHGEDLPESSNRLIDRLGRENLLADFELTIAVDFGDRDLRQPVGVEERQQVVAELPRVVGDGRLAQLAAAGRQPRRCELVERRRLRRLRRWPDARRPEAALDVGENVAQLGLRLLPRPTFIRAAEGYELARP